jgi:hypothetical protein
MPSIGAYQATRNAKARHYTLENVTRLAGALEEPADAIYKLFLSVRQDRRRFSYLVIMFGTKVDRSHGR